MGRLGHRMNLIGGPPGVWGPAPIVSADPAVADYDPRRAGITVMPGSGGTGGLCFRDYRDVTIGGDAGYASLGTLGWYGSDVISGAPTPGPTLVAARTDPVWGQCGVFYNQPGESPTDNTDAAGKRQAKWRFTADTPSLNWWWRTVFRTAGGNQNGNRPATIAAGDGVTQWWSPYGATAGGAKALKFLLAYHTGGNRFGIDPQNNPSNMQVQQGNQNASATYTQSALSQGGAPYARTSLQVFGNIVNAGTASVACTDFCYGNPSPIGQNWFECILSCWEASPTELWQRFFLRRLTTTNGVTFAPDSDYRWDGVRLTLTSGSWFPYDTFRYFDAKNSNNDGPNLQQEELARCEVLLDADPYGLAGWGA